MEWMHNDIHSILYVPAKKTHISAKKMQVSAINEEH